MTFSLRLPAAFITRQRRSVEGRAWLQRLPEQLQQLLQEWELTPELSAHELPWTGFTGVVLPVRTRAAERAVLKISVPVQETLSEAPALELWGGTGAVRLLRRDVQGCALLLERLDERRTLWDLPLADSIPIWGSLMRSLAIPVPEDSASAADIPRLDEMAERWCDELPQSWQDLGEPFPRWLLEAALEVCQDRGVVGRRQTQNTLVHADLHFQNILARPDSTPAHWLAIDPQAVIGDPAYALPPVLRNKLADYGPGNPAQTVPRRLHDFANAAGIDPADATAWSVVSFVEDALWHQSRPGHDGAVQRSIWLASGLLGRVFPENIDPARLPDPGHIEQRGVS